jgi:hypothetical protein
VWLAIGRGKQLGIVTTLLAFGSFLAHKENSENPFIFLLKIGKLSKKTIKW